MADEVKKSWRDMAWSERYEQLITPLAGKGPSVTKWAFLRGTALSLYCATLATVGGVAVYVFNDKADAIYWGAVAGLWVNSLGFITSAKKHQTTATKEMALAQANQATTAGTETDGGPA